MDTILTNIIGFIFILWDLIIVIWDKFWWVTIIILIYIYSKEYKAYQDKKMKDFYDNLYHKVTKPLQTQLEKIEKELKQLKK